jgi:putative AlgH/UPF0301 family transcriptional regulator
VSSNVGTVALPSGSDACPYPAAAAAAPQPPLRVYHGVAAWQRGQLEGELRAGAWGLCTGAQAADVLRTPPEHLWGRLQADGRLQWLR